MADQGSESLARWLISGLLAGAAVLGIAIAAYAVGYHRGRHHGRAPVAASTHATTQAATQTTPATTSSAAPVTPTPALVAQGKQLYTADGCAACHSLNGSPGAGPSFKGLAGTTVSLDGGQSATADDAYLSESITSPDAKVVKGYHGGIMGPAIGSFDLSTKPNDVRALVAFIKTQK